MRPGPSPLVGYNTNVRHKGKLFHIQTEDSGVNHPHVITHLFADGGRIIASRKTGYAEHLGAKDLQGIVKKLMQEQHKAMFIELRDCVYDEDGPGDEAPQLGATEAVAPEAPAPPPAAAAKGAPSERPLVASLHPRSNSAPLQDIDVEALERAAEARVAESLAGRSRGEGPRRGTGRYQQTVPAHDTGTHAKVPSRPSIFGGEALRGKSLDEVILSYLSDDVGERER
ncbi:MAG TPA: hypothetical protein VHM19_00540 [Polyangiales bacterium]|jgi:hypothetical protein|nr:hypothetical protein [Polyangiales bacterium]